MGLLPSPGVFLRIGDGAAEVNLVPVDFVLEAIARLGAPLARHLEPGAAGELLDRLGKRQPLVLHQERQCRAVRAAAEAVIELLRLAYRERRGLLAVERAAGDVVGAGLLEGNEAVDDVDDVDAVAGELAGRGVVFERAIEDQDYGCRDFDVREPDGHLIGIGQKLAKG